MRYWTLELHDALELADQLLAAAEDVKDPAMLLVANFARGVVKRVVRIEPMRARKEGVSGELKLIPSAAEARTERSSAPPCFWRCRSP
jgi:hypothetical protein